MQLAIHGGSKTIDEQDARFNWPVIDLEAESAILNQLKDSISIYDKSGVFASFENDFAAYHSRTYGLLSNSGTSSIFAMFEAINLQPGDEVLCPVYTFHATVSPMLYTGAVPVFCDSDDEGNISLEAVKAKISDKTKAVIVTHMWGVPVQDIAAIANFCRERNIYLFEDCSHAHGASIDGKKVGSFGDISAWSLQGQKVITGGEGGILLTDNKTLYDRALLQGHYNKRPKIEIDNANPLKKFYLTGMGLKLRAHPIAIALASQQFSHLDEFIAQKEANAKRFSDAFGRYVFLSVPGNSTAQNSWYAYGLHYDYEKAHGVSREQFVEALHAEGLVEADIPGSTGLLNEVPLFTRPHEIMPRLYKNSLPTQRSFPNAQKFYDSLIKFPVWAMPGDDSTVESYIAGVCKVADYIMANKKL